MATDDGLEPKGENHLLASLPEPDRRAIEARLTLVDLDTKDLIYQPNVPIDHVYFPLSGVISLLTVLEDGSALEVATVGNEGMAGVPVYLGAGSTPGRGIAQVPGRALRMRAADFRDAIGRHPALVDLLNRYVQGLFNQIAQTAACNRAHLIERRCARWLLMTHDRAGEDAFQLTHEFLSQMLGVRRASVTEAAGTLQAAGLITYARGIVTVEDRAGLEAASCECYRIIRDEYHRLLG